MSCATKVWIERYAGDKITVTVDVLMDDVRGMDLSSLTPDVQIDSSPPVEPTYDVSKMDTGVLTFTFSSLQTAAITPGQYTIGCRMIMEDSEPITFLAISTNLMAAAVAA